MSTPRPSPTASLPPASTIPPCPPSAATKPRSSIPRSNPFLRKLFGYIAGPDIDDRIRWIVDSLIEIFLACNVEEILKNYGKQTRTEDPIIHFYETFLSEYDPRLRKARGVWYTPAPVVNFIVRAVDEILQTEFHLPRGLADTSRTKVKVSVPTHDKRATSGLREVEQEVHKVQILDPATGTGTFLAEVVKQIHAKFKGQQGLWSSYVEKELLPRLNGFELLMASYAMAHLQLDLLLKETGFKSENNQRLRVFLTNTLEEFNPYAGELPFAGAIADEANAADRIKRDTPVMCVIGNPPYSGISTNNGKWISDLIDNYKYIDGAHFNERKHWLNDDYVKFIRFGQHFIDKNGEGVLAFINNHSFIDNPTFRGMRWHLLNSFDTIYVIDLHGNSKKKEISPDGTPDKNVFDIQAGVSINLFVKTGKKKKTELAKVQHLNVWGSRESKYEFLLENSLKSLRFNEVNFSKPFYFFQPKNINSQEEYENGFKIEDLFPESTSGIQTSRDFLVIDDSKAKLLKRISSFSDINITDDEIRKSFFPNASSSKYLKGDTRGWRISEVRPKLRKLNIESIIKRISYRPFDVKFITYTPLLVDWTREKIQKHLLQDNLSITVGRQGQVTGDIPWNLIFIQNTISDLNLFYRGGGIVCPLYLYPETTTQLTTDSKPTRTPNLSPAIVQQIADRLQLRFTPEKEASGATRASFVHTHSDVLSVTVPGTFAPLDLLDYSYAVLHSPAYRERYKEFLKIDFPRVPYPATAERFFQLAALGAQLRQLHLLESPKVHDLITQYPVDGPNTVEKIRFETYCYEPTAPDENGDFHYPDYLGAVYINDTQFFADVPTSAWDFYIGGYQPAQKWLKDRKGRTLSFEDILHYQQIIVALTETARLMQEIDKVGVEQNED